MNKVDVTVKRVTKYIALFVLIFSAVMEAVFIVIGKWDISVLFGNLLGSVVAVLNFFLMGLTVQKAVKQDEKRVKNTVKVSQLARLLMIIATAAVGYLAPVFNLVAVLVPLFFPRIAIFLIPLVNKDFRKEMKEEKERYENSLKNEVPDDTEDTDEDKEEGDDA